MHHGYLVPIREGLEKSLRQGERISLTEISESIVEENGYDQDKAKLAAMGVIVRIRGRLAETGLPLIRVSNGEYGLPKNQDDVAFAMTNYGLSIERVLGMANLLKQYSTAKNILPKGFTENTIKIPAFTV